jgi:hypothetical protein
MKSDSDAKIGNLFIGMGSNFKKLYEVYSQSNPNFTNAINKNK